MTRAGRGRGGGWLSRPVRGCGGAWPPRPGRGHLDPRQDRHLVGGGRGTRCATTAALRRSWIGAPAVMARGASVPPAPLPAAVERGGPGSRFRHSGPMPRRAQGGRGVAHGPSAATPPWLTSMRMRVGPCRAVPRCSRRDLQLPIPRQWAHESRGWGKDNGPGGGRLPPCGPTPLRTGGRFPLSQKHD